MSYDCRLLEAAVISIILSYLKKIPIPFKIALCLFSRIFGKIAVASSKTAGLSTEIFT